MKCLNTLTPLIKEFLEKNKALIESADMVVHDEIIIQKSSACGPTGVPVDFDMSMFDRPIIKPKKDHDV